ncbi:MAG TPA: hypothetical protein VGG72_13490 [Bryobacteraceae bacterium]
MAQRRNLVGREGQDAADRTRHSAVSQGISVAGTRALVTEVGIVGGGDSGFSNRQLAEDELAAEGRHSSGL